MRFWLIDAIKAFEQDARVVAVKNVSYSEEYLRDHFPEFPVLPGVFMLEAATQAAAWLLRLSDNYEHAIIELREAKNIKYADFVPPGSQLQVSVEMMKKEERLATFKVSGTISDRPSLSGRIVLERYNLADDDPELADTDARLRGYFKKWSAAILTPELAAAASA